MKKIVVFLMCTCFFSTPVMAGMCDGGTEIIAHKVTDPGCTAATDNIAATCNGKTFCKSNARMNWWSAHAWCESQGLKLANFSDMCPGVPQPSGATTGNCPNLNGVAEKGNVWSSLTSGSHYAIVVSLSSGTVSRNYRENDCDGCNAALCE